MKRQSKFTSRQSEQEQQQISAQHSHEYSGHEFASVEDMLRHDAINTPVPPTIGHRLEESIGPAQPRSWWRRLFGS
jgi:hypothetical protein